MLVLTQVSTVCLDNDPFINSVSDWVDIQADEYVDYVLAMIRLLTVFRSMMMMIGSMYR